MKNKRGQIFLIIALVVIGIIIGLSFTYTKTRAPQEESRVIDLSNEIYYEGAQVVDRGVYSGQQGGIENKINGLIGNYSQLNPDSEITVIYGSQNGLIYRCKESGTAAVGNAVQPLCELDVELFETPEPIDGVITFSLGEETYSFNLEDASQNFFIVIKKETAAGQEIVAT